MLRARLDDLVVAGLDVELDGLSVEVRLVVGLSGHAAIVRRDHALACHEEHVLRAGIPVRGHGDGDGIDARLARCERVVWLEVREAAFPVCYKLLVKSGLMTWESFLARLTTGPAKILDIEVPAISVELDLNSHNILDINQFHSKSLNCPWNGYPGWGKVLRVF